MTDQKDGKPPAEDAGRISHDARGNAVWQWAGTATRHALDSTSRMLKRLDVPGLKLLDEPGPDDKPAVDPAEALKASRAAGFDPYDGTSKGSFASQQRPATKTPTSRIAPKPALRPAAGTPTSVSPVPARRAEKPAEKPSFLGRLFGRDRDR